jgi:signal transduction histidine kinase
MKKVKRAVEARGRRGDDSVQLSRTIRAFSRISRLGLATTSPHDTGTRLLREVCRALELERAEIWLFGPNTRRLWRFAAHGSGHLLADHPSGLPIEECAFTRLVLRRRQGVHHPRAARAGRSRRTPLQRSVTSAFGAPLTVRGRSIGLIYADRGGAPFDMTASELELGSALSALCADVLQRGRSRHQEARRQQQMGLLNAIGQAMIAHEDLTKLLPAGARLLRRHLGCRGVAIGLYRSQGRQLEVVAVAGAGGPRPVGRRFEVQSGPPKIDICRRATLSRKPVSLSDSRLLPRTLVWWRGVRTVLSIPMRVRGGVTGVIRLESERPFAFDQEDQAVLAVAGEQLGHAVRRAQAMEDLHLRQRDVQAISASLERMLEEERRRIAGELHDELAQSMTAAKINLGLIRQLMPHAGAEAKRAVRETENIVRQTIAEIRRIAMDLRPAMLDDLGLVPALNWLADTFSRRTGIAVSLDADGTLAPADAEIRTLLYRFVQEALTNVARHARARSVRIDLSAADGRIRASVDDDGKGIRRAAGRRSTGFGLIGMRERIERVGGNLSIESRSGIGTRLVAEVPRDARATAPRPVAPPLRRATGRAGWEARA